MRASDDAGVTAVGAARERLLTTVEYGVKSGLFDPSAAMRDYRNALEDSPRLVSEIMAARYDLSARLTHGLTVEGGDDLYAELLRRLEACEDLIDPAAASGRLARLEMRIAERMVSA